MEQLRSFADDRLIVNCIYCGAPADTGDHVPSKVFLDPPLPTNLPTVGACKGCNNGFSADEEYLACLVEAAVAGTTDPEHIRRATVARALRRSTRLRAMLEAAGRQVDGRTAFMPDPGRVLNVIVKLARGHAAFELSEPCREDPTHVSYRPLPLMTDQERDDFDEGHFPDVWPEVGSRAMQRMLVIQPRIAGPGGGALLPGFIMQDWIEVQEGRYAYLASQDGTDLRVRILIGDYLACDVRWGTRSAPISQGKSFADSDRPVVGRAPPLRGTPARTGRSAPIL